MQVQIMFNKITMKQNAETVKHNKRDKSMNPNINMETRCTLTDENARLRVLYTP